jgi:hypothetical protein
VLARRRRKRLRPLRATPVDRRTKADAIDTKVVMAGTAIATGTAVISAVIATAVGTSTRTRQHPVAKGVAMDGVMVIATGRSAMASAMSANTVSIRTPRAHRRSNRNNSSQRSNSSNNNSSPPHRSLKQHRNLQRPGATTSAATAEIAEIAEIAETVGTVGTAVPVVADVVVVAAGDAVAKAPPPMRAQGTMPKLARNLRATRNTALIWPRRVRSNRA